MGSSPRRRIIVAAGLASAVALALAGVSLATHTTGAATHRAGAAAPAKEVPLEPAPPLRAVDEPAPAEVKEMLDLSFDSTAASGESVCIDLVFGFNGINSAASGGGDSGGGCDSAQAQQLEAQARQQDEQLSRAPGAQPRVLAELPLASGGTDYLIEYLSRGGRYRGFEQQENPDGSGGGGGFELPCTASNNPDALALGGSRVGSTWVISGTVPAQTGVLRLTFEDGYQADYRVTGPAVPHYPDRHAFALESTHGEYRAAEARADGQVLAQFAFPPEMPTTAQLEAQMRAELRRRGISVPDGVGANGGGWLAVSGGLTAAGSGAPAMDGPPPLPEAN